MRIDILFLATVSSVLVSACSSSDPSPLRVRQFHMNTARPADDTAQMVRGEQLYRLRGSVTTADRLAKLGQYYTVQWRNINDAPAPLSVIMDYEQSATGAKRLQMVRHLPAGEDTGEVEFHINGVNFQRNGRVLSWRIRLMSGDQVVDEKRSYLWR